MNRTIPLDHFCEYHSGGKYCTRQRHPAGRFCPIHARMVMDATREKRSEKRTQRWLDSWVERVKDNG